MNGDRFEAMGCEIVLRGGTSSEHIAVRDLFRQRELAFSRFIPQSELNRVNGSSGRFVRVSELFADTVRIALRAAEETDGLVDPTVGVAIETAGYTRDLSVLGPDPEPPGPASPGEWRSVIVLRSRIGVPAGIRLDLNGVVKALAVDDALSLIPGDGFVSAGGDLAARGEVTVALPDGEAVLLRRGALATSGTTRRRWMRAGRVQHHLIDPRTGRPARSPWAQVTTCGASCLAADIAAKAGFLLGRDGPEWLDQRGMPARFLTPDGKPTLNEAWRSSMDEALACT
ncbi:MAG: FAD:protein FMN transferase [Actinomycetota bacterium]|nr:FAD:protein FMN transferase [Actinomycetota bacterium]